MVQAVEAVETGSGDGTTASTGPAIAAELPGHLATDFSSVL